MSVCLSQILYVLLSVTMLGFLYVYLYSDKLQSKTSLVFGVNNYVNV